MQFIGRAPDQVDQFVAEIVGPIREKYAGQGPDAEVRV